MNAFTEATSADGSPCLCLISSEADWLHGKGVDFWQMQKAPVT